MRRRRAVALIALFLGIWAIPASAQTPDRLFADIDPHGCACEPQMARSAITSELRVNVFTADEKIRPSRRRNWLSVSGDGRKLLVVTWIDQSGKVLTRRVEKPAEPVATVRTIAFLAGNLVRNEAAEILASRRARPLPPPKPKPTQTLPPPAVTARTSSPRLDLQVDLSGSASLRGGEREAGFHITSRTQSLAPDLLRLAASGYWGAFGGAADFSLGRFRVTGQQPSTGESATADVSANESYASAAAAARVSPVAPLQLEGMLGYAFGSTPLIAVTPEGTISFSQLAHHGPLLAANARWRINDRMTARLGARYLPLAVGASGAAVDAFSELGGSAELSYGNWEWSGLYWSGLARYEGSTSTAAATGDAITQSAHRFGLGARVWAGGQGGRLRGRLLLPDGSGAAGLRVRASGFGEVVTGSRGEFHVNPAGPGTVVLQVKADGFQPLERRVRVPPGGKASIDLALAVQPTGPGQIRGRILRVETASSSGTMPLSGALVDNDGLGALTDDDGSFTLERVGPGAVSLFVWARGYEPIEESVTVPPEGVAEADFVLKKSEQPLAILRLFVKAAGGEPVAKAKVRIYEAHQTVETGDNGRLTTRLPRGRYQLSVQKPGYSGELREIVVQEDEPESLTIELKPAR